MNGRVIPGARASCPRFFPGGYAEDVVEGVTPSLPGGIPKGARVFQPAMETTSASLHRADVAVSAPRGASAVGCGVLRRGEPACSPYWKPGSICGGPACSPYWKLGLYGGGRTHRPAPTINPGLGWANYWDNKPPGPQPYPGPTNGRFLPAPRPLKTSSGSYAGFLPRYLPV